MCQLSPRLPDRSTPVVRLLGDLVALSAGSKPSLMLKAATTRHRSPDRPIISADRQHGSSMLIACLMTPPRRSLPPDECCLSTSPIQADRLRPELKAFGSGTLA